MENVDHHWSKSRENIAFPLTSLHVDYLNANVLIPRTRRRHGLELARVARGRTQPSIRLLHNLRDGILLFLLALAWNWYQFVNWFAAESCSRRTVCRFKLRQKSFLAVCLNSIDWHRSPSSLPEILNLVRHCFILSRVDESRLRLCG